MLRCGLTQELRQRDPSGLRELVGQCEDFQSQDQQALGVRVQGVLGPPELHSWGEGGPGRASGTSKSTRGILSPMGTAGEGSGNTHCHFPNGPEVHSAQVSDARCWEQVTVQAPGTYPPRSPGPERAHPESSHPGRSSRWAACGGDRVWYVSREAPSLHPLLCGQGSGPRTKCLLVSPSPSLLP